MKTTAQEVQKKESLQKEGAERTRSKRIFIPAIDIIERKDDILLIADMPGVDEDSIDITLEKDVLTLYGKVETHIPEDHRLVLSEYGVGDYQRTFTISDEVDREKIQATVKNGVLRLILPKTEKVKTRKIQVRSDV